MSFDLSFYRPKGKPPLTEEEFLGHFQGRAHYQISEARAAYENEDTGVYFSFSYSDASNSEGDEDEGTGEVGPRSAWFNMNYCRPHTFALEAEPEVTAFVQALALQIYDPQTGGMGRGKYTPEGFLRSWNSGNKFGTGAILAMKQGADPVPVLPSAVIEGCWRWNYERQDFGERRDRVAFAPRIMFLRHNGRVCTLIVWSDEVITALPAVDLVVVNRRPSQKKNDLTLIEWAELKPDLGHFDRETVPMDHLMPRFEEEVPDEILKFCRSTGTPIRGKLDWVPVDQILDQELVESCRPRST
jgi:hypothetical protein